MALRHSGTPGFKTAAVALSRAGPLGVRWPTSTLGGTPVDRECRVRKLALAGDSTKEGTDVNENTARTFREAAMQLSKRDLIIRLLKTSDAEMLLGHDAAEPQEAERHYARSLELFERVLLMSGR